MIVNTCLSQCAEWENSLGVYFDIEDDDEAEITFQLSDTNTPKPEGGTFSLFMSLSSAPYHAIDAWTVQPAEVRLHMPYGNGLCSPRRQDMNCTRNAPVVGSCSNSAHCPLGSTCIDGIGIQPLNAAKWTPQNWTTITTIELLVVDDTMVEGSLDVLLTVEVVSGDMLYHGRRMSTLVTVEDNDSSRVEITSFSSDDAVRVSDVVFAAPEGFAGEFSFVATNPLYYPAVFVARARGQIEIEISADDIRLEQSDPDWQAFALVGASMHQPRSLLIKSEDSDIDEPRVRSAEIQFTFGISSEWCQFAEVVGGLQFIASTLLPAPEWEIMTAHHELKVVDDDVAGLQVKPWSLDGTGRICHTSGSKYVP